MKTILLFAVMMQVPSGSGNSAKKTTIEKPNPAVAEATGALLQADGPRAIAILKAAATAEKLDTASEQFRRCIVERLHHAPVAEAGIGPVSSQALSAYRLYWRDAASRPSSRDTAEKKLLASLTGLLGRPLTSMDDAEALLKERLDAEHVFSLQGRTGYLRDLMIWTSQTQHDYEVKLPEGLQKTRVMFLNDFKSRGWEYYLACDHAGVGGWTTSNALYLVVPAYQRLDDEGFRVNYLAHESQHFADKTCFPEMGSWELEYRAKLVEVALAVETSGETLRAFERDQGDDPASLHSYADKRVLAALAGRLQLPEPRELENVPLALLQSAAVEELKTDTVRRIAVQSTH